ncbi:MAG TPA: hypothetical protein VNE39_12535 [Planctomycetota bacterium]|nr:hypothetical protein [Planctomycetota bacterium]
MPAESGKSVDEQLAKLGKEVVWLRLAVILTLVILALVAVAVLQMRNPVVTMMSEQASPATRSVGAGRFTLLEVVDTLGAKGKEMGKSRVRAELCVRDGGARLMLYDADGKCVWTTPAPPAPEPGTGTKAPEPEKEK